MQDLEGRVAVVTGAASGIGRGISERLLASGAKVVLADLEGPRLEQTRSELAGLGEVVAVETDVSKFEDVEALAAGVEEHFGGVHILCNNAGVGAGRVPTWDSTLDDWSWIIGVNLMGVIHGVKAFVPGMVSRGEAAAVVNTSSMAGLGVNPANAMYGVTKHAVVALTESLHCEFQRLAPHVQAHVLCPGFVATRIYASDRNRPAGLASEPVPEPSPERELFEKIFTSMIDEGLSPEAVGDLVVESILTNRFYILPHPWQDMIEARMRGILDGKAPAPAMPPGIAERLSAALARFQK